MSRKALLSLFAHKSWANNELFNVLATVTSPEHDGAVHTAIRTLNHIHVLTHGAYHCGNVGQLLKSISLAPPRDLHTQFLRVLEPERRQA
jgi:uncharacterized damage-inducible protein DinB